MRLLLTSLCLIICLSANGQVVPLPQAHAHNDYEHDRPLLDALAQGFTSVEADVHLIDGELYVAHARPLFKNMKKTLQALYLEPLAQRVRANEGSVYPAYEGEFLLMIDIKADGEAVYRLLHQQLEAYRDILTFYESGEKKRGAVTIFLSGDRPVDLAKADPNRLVGIDGRPSDLGKGYTADFMPVISDNYRKHLSWRGKKRNKKPAELEALKKWIAEAHEEGKKVRLWATPERKKVWRVLLEAGVDFLNTDQLSELQGFLIKKR